MSSEQIDRAFEKTDNIAADEIDSFDGDINDFYRNKNRENKRIACKYIQMHKNSYVIVKIQWKVRNRLRKIVIIHKADLNDGLEPTSRGEIIYHTN